MEDKNIKELEKITNLKKMYEELERELSKKLKEWQERLIAKSYMQQNNQILLPQSNLVNNPQSPNNTNQNFNLSGEFVEFKEMIIVIEYNKDKDEYQIKNINKEDKKENQIEVLNWAEALKGNVSELDVEKILENSKKQIIKKIDELHENKELKRLQTNNKVVVQTPPVVETPTVVTPKVNDGIPTIIEEYDDYPTIPEPEPEKVVTPPEPKDDDYPTIPNDWDDYPTIPEPKDDDYVKTIPLSSEISISNIYPYTSPNPSLIDIDDSNVSAKVVFNSVQNTIKTPSFAYFQEQNNVQERPPEPNPHLGSEINTTFNIGR